MRQTQNPQPNQGNRPLIPYLQTKSANQVLKYREKTSGVFGTIFFGPLALQTGVREAQDGLGGCGQNLEARPFHHQAQEEVVEHSSWE